MALMALWIKKEKKLELFAFSPHYSSLAVHLFVLKIYCPSCTVVSPVAKEIENGFVANHVSFIHHRISF